MQRGFPLDATWGEVSPAIVTINGPGVPPKGCTLPGCVAPFILLPIPVPVFTMRFPLYATALAATASALVIGERASSEDRYILELAPGVTKEVTEAEKWALKAVSIRISWHWR